MMRRNKSYREQRRQQLMTIGLLVLIFICGAIAGHVVPQMVDYTLRMESQYAGYEQTMDKLDASAQVYQENRKDGDD